MLRSSNARPFAQSYGCAAYAGAFPTVAPTSDDAFRSVGTRAVPEVLSRRFPATIFLPLDLLGKNPGWETTTEVGWFLFYLKARGA